MIKELEDIFKRTGYHTNKYDMLIYSYNFIKKIEIWYIAKPSGSSLTSLILTIKHI